VVATRVGGTADLLAEGSHGLLVPPGDPKALAAAILVSLREPAAARMRALTGRATVLERYSAARLIDDVDQLYRDLLAARSMAA